MKFRLNILLGVAGIVTALSAATAQAAIIGGFLNTIHFVDGEQLATYNNSTQTYTATSTFAVGDHLYGVSDQILSTAPNGNTVFDIVVAKIINPLTGASIDPATITTPTPVEILYTSDSALISAANLGAGNVGGTGGFLTGSGPFTLADGSTVTGLGANANTLDALYLGTKLDDTTAPPSGTSIVTGSQGDGIKNASTGGVLYGNFGLGTSLNDTSSNSAWGTAGTGYWASDVVLGAGGTVLSTSVPFSLGLIDLSPNIGFVPIGNADLPLAQGGEFTGTDGTNIHNNYPAAPLTPVTGFDLTGGGHALPGIPVGTPPGPPGPWGTSSFDPLQIDPVAPEPGTIVIMGVGLIFGGSYLRRRQKAAA